MPSPPSAVRSSHFHRRWGLALLVKRAARVVGILAGESAVAARLISQRTAAVLTQEWTIYVGAALGVVASVSAEVSELPRCQFTIKIQAADASAHALPAGHVRQSSADMRPVSLPNRPAGQSTQNDSLLAPTPPQYFPLGQSTQTAAPVKGPYVPLGQD